MSEIIRDKFSEAFPIVITPDKLKIINNLVLRYELRGEHPDALNFSLVGVYKIIFTDDDMDVLFGIFDTSRDQVRKVINTFPKIKVKIDNVVKEVDIRKFNVGGDPFNLFIMWIVHNILIHPRTSDADKRRTVINLLNYWQYRFFSSAINHYFKYSAKRDIMQNVIENLNLKFSIKRLETWKKVIEERSFTLLMDKDEDHQGIHVNTLHSFNDDGSIVYVITDNSTRIRSQLQNIMELYYEYKKQYDFISSTSSTTEMDGEKIVREISSSFENITNQMFSKMIYKQAFINESYIREIVKMFPGLNVSILKRTIIVACDVANMQKTAGTQNKEVRKSDGSVRYEGFELILDKIIYSVYSQIVRDRTINMNNKLAIFAKAKSILTVHRSSNYEIIHVKESLKDFIIKNRISKREATISALINAFLIYTILISFEFYRKR